MNKPLSSLLRRPLSMWLFLAFFPVFLTAQLPNGFIDAKVQDGYAAPMGVIFSKNGQRMFVWEKSGKIWCSDWNGTTYVKKSTPMLNISDEVGDWRDFGLASVCLDPNFDNNGLIYLFYMVDRHHLLYYGTPQYSATTNTYYQASISRVTRYRINLGTNPTTDYTSRKVLLGESKTTGVPLVHESHAGGTLVFGTDGTLLITTGDNASYASVDKGSASETYWQQAINDGIMRSQENVGAFRSQMVNSFCGKVLRIDPNTGDGIASNPFYDAASPRSPKSRVWALGLRNPFRMSFWSGTGSTNPADGNPGTLLVGDVGWNTWEDFHVIDKGGLNCGWPVYEGQTNAGGYYGTNVPNQDESNQTFENLCRQPTSPTVNPTPSQRRFTHSRPALAWKHGANDARVPWFSGTTPTDPQIGIAGSPATGTLFGGNCAAGGVFYTGTGMGSFYQNSYFFADFGQNWIKNVTLHNTGDHWIHEVREFAPTNYAKGIVDLEQNPLDNSIFYVNINTGTIQKLSLGGNRPPVAVLTADKLSGTSPLTVNFSSAGSSDPDGNPITYLWDFGDGTTSTLANPTKTFTATGSRGFTVRLTVTDNQGLADSKTLTVSINNTAPSVRITNPTDNAQYSLTQATTYTLQSNVVDNDVTGMQYAWQVTLRHNNHEHREPINNQASPSVQISPVGCDGETYYYLIELTVTDNGGLTAKDSVKIYPNCATANLSVSNLTAAAQQNAVLLNWTNPSTTFDEIMVVAKAAAGFTTNPSGTNYTADANFTGTGTAFEGGKVVYRGIGNAVTVTNLIGGTRYYFRVFTRKGTAWTGGVETSAVPTAPAITLGCVRASYFNNINLSGTPLSTRNETSINNDWGTAAPAVTGMPADNFSIRYEGNIVSSVAGNYTFTITADDGVRFWLNGVLVLDKWFDQAPTTYTITSALTANKSCPIKLEYYERGGGAVAKLWWTVPGQASQSIAFGSNCTTPPTSLFDPAKCYRIVARHSGKTLEVASSLTTNGAQVRQWTWNGTKTQLWKLKDNADGSFRMVNANSGKVADVSGASTANGAAIQQWDWTGGNNQRWIFTKNTEGYFQIKAKHSNSVMDIYGGQTTDGAKVIQWAAHSGFNQQFSVSEATCPAGVVAAESANMLTIEAHRVGKTSVINWVSNSNGQNDYFIVQRLGFDNSFEHAQYLNAKTSADATTKQYYSYTDVSPSEGDNIYRVLLYREGETTPQYSELVVVSFEALSDFTVFPNPANDFVDIDMDDALFNAADIQIINLKGQILLQKHYDKVTERVIRLSLNGLETGQYLVRIQPQDKREVVKKLSIGQ
ncbi:MAG: RICIN domain-containing protein [Saprospiraceae bacterium]|nr:RICIN domain-containing protein [Saprospiraceae bacterium]